MRETGLGLLAFALACCGGAQAQEVTFGASSSLESGWTSNASETVDGAADGFVRHEDGIEIVIAGDGGVLRGSVGFTQTRFFRTAYEADDEIGVEIESELVVAPGVQLRLGYRLDQAWRGDELDLGVIALPFRTSETRQEIGAELVAAVGAGAVSAGASWERANNGIAEFARGVLPPLRLAADVGLVTGRLAWEADLGQGVALLAEATGRLVDISAQDREGFGRLPAHGVQLAAGLASASAQASALRVLAGFDVVMPEGRADLVRVAPFADAVFSTAVTTELALNMEAGFGVERLDPVDGVAARTTRLGFGLTYGLGASAELFASWAGTREVGIYGSELTVSERVISVGLVLRPNAALAVEVTLERSARFDGPARIDQDRISLGLAAEL